MTNSWPILPHPTQKDQVGGHEGVGKVVKLGPGAERSTIKLGDRVGVKWIASACGSCPACLEGADGVCFKQEISGYYHPGTFQQYVLGPANYVTPIPDALDSAEAAPMMCAGTTVYSALRKSNARSGQWVIIVGSGGGLGHIAVQLSSRGMAHRVIGIDAPGKDSITLSSGAEHFVPFGPEHTNEEVTAQVLKLTGGLGASAVIVCPASNAAYAQAMAYLRFGGTLVCVGMPYGEGVPVAGACPVPMICKQHTVTGSMVGNRSDAIEVLDFAARGIIKTHYRLEKMEKLTEIFDEIHNGKMIGRVVLDLQ